MATTQKNLRFSVFTALAGVDRQTRALVTRPSKVKQKLNSAVIGASRRQVFDSEIFALAIPTLGAVLVDPCLSLVDTGYVGRLGALSLASIGPCTAAFNVVFVTARCVKQLCRCPLCMFRFVQGRVVRCF